MKHPCFLLFFLSAVFITTHAQNRPEAISQFSNNNEVYFRMNNISRVDLEALQEWMSIDTYSADGTAHAYSTVKNLNDLVKNEKFFDLELLQHPGTLIKPVMKTDVDINSITEWDFYPGYEAYVDMMYQFQEDYPDLCQVTSIGQSNEGRELLMAIISDNPPVDNGEPQILYISSIHGDEATGYVLFLRLINYLLSNYETDLQVKNLVDNLEIWINPLANPDGTFAGGNSSLLGATRFNANGVDLNRNFPDPKGGDHPDNNPWQTETVHYMNLAEENNFVMAINCHGGEEVFNYPWDTWEKLHADDDWWYFAGREWVDTVHAYGPIGYFDSFDDGVSNGFQWYSIEGGRQDYMNYFHHCREVTLEISNAKMVPAEMLPDYWEYNYRSFLNYMTRALYGVKGTVSDAITGNPLKASVFVENHDMDESWIGSDEKGWFFRPIYAGTYDLTFYCPGYALLTVENVQVSNYSSTTLNVELSPTGSGVGDHKLADMFTMRNNPGNGDFLIEYKETEPLLIELLVVDAMGRTLTRSSKLVSSAMPDANVNLKAHQDGLYFLIIRAGDYAGSFKLIKQ